MNKKILVISNGLIPPFDEGFKNFARNLSEAFKNIKEIDSEVISINSKFSNIERKTFLSKKIKNSIKSLKPELIIYIPTSSLTVASIFRAWLLKKYRKNAKVAFVSLQPRHSKVNKLFLKFFKLDVVLTLEEKELRFFKEHGISCYKVPAGVNLKKFTPVTNETKKALRRKYNLNEKDYILLHVGHINKNRNIQLIPEIAKKINGKSLIVGSTSTLQDSTLKKELESTQTIFINQYIENTEELYQLADCYIFPVINHDACIEIPLSILEAMACNIPVVTTRFGGLEDYFSEKDGFYYIDEIKDFYLKTSKIKSIENIKTREQVQKLSWNEIAKKILTTI